MKTMDLLIQPIHYGLDDRIGAHVFLCMLAYSVEWHLRSDLAPILFDDHDRAAAERVSIVAPRSPAARTKDQTKHTADGFAAHSVRTLLAALGTHCKNRVRMARGSTAAPARDFFVLTKPTDGQQWILNRRGATLSP